MPFNSLENPDITNIRLRITALKKEFIQFNLTLTHVSDDYDKEMLMRSSDLSQKRDSICHDLSQLKALALKGSSEHFVLLALNRHCYFSLNQKYEVSGLPFPFT